MTAISLIVTDAAAHLVTDASFYDATGRLAQIRTKVTVSHTLGMAIACSGCADINQLAIRLEAVETQAQALAKLPDVVTGIRAENRYANPDGEANGYNDLMLFVAIWSRDRRRAEGWVISSNRSYLGAGYQPGTLIEVEGISSPPVPFAMFDPRDQIASAGAILDLQRDAEWVPGETRRHVGGFGELTTVTAAGITRDRVREWPDVIGEQIARL